MPRYKGRAYALRAARRLATMKREAEEARRRAEKILRSSREQVTSRGALTSRET